MKQTYNVIIIGAGASGLAAAKELEDKGIDSVCILEGTDRIGGRIKTIESPSGGFIDLGAQWIHGQEDNYLYNFANPLGLIGEKLSVDGEGDFYTDKHKLLNENLVNEVLGALWSFKKDAESLCEVDNERPESLGHYLRERFINYLNPLTMKSPQEKELMEAIFHWDNRWIRIDNACDSLDTLSVARWGDFHPCKGHYNLNPKYGMFTIIDHLAKTLRKTQIQLGCQVKEVNYCEELVESPPGHYRRKDGSHPVIIKCKNGSVYECNHVIVTCSLGYLKKNKDNLFHPRLPPSTDKAIENLGFGVIDKIFLEFEKPFWGPNFTGYHLVWTGNEIPDLNRNEPNTKLINGDVVDPKDYWFRAISGFDPIYGHRSILCGWIGGSEAVTMEELSEEEVKDQCVSLLRKFTGQNIPEPIRIFRSKWGTDELFLGSYSNRSNSSDRSIEGIDPVRILNQPIYAKVNPRKKFPIVVFAGEANSSHYFSTVHGALSNGKSQASHYINFINGIKPIEPASLTSKL